VQRLLVKLKAAKVRGIVLDLRRNGGGSLEEAIRLTGLFIPKGPVVQTRGPNGDVEVAEDTDPTEQYAGPLLVLVSRMSASASEILAGALQDYGRALIVGDTSTFGKGTVQSIMPLAPIMRENDLPYDHDPGALKITIRKFYRPSGASTQLRGVSADIVIPSNTDVTEISEAAQKDPLPWDTIKAARYDTKSAVKPFLDALRKQSAERVAKEQPFTYVKESLAQARDRLAVKRASLNEAQRRQELARDKARQHALAAFWEGYRSTAPKSYTIRLKDVAATGLPPAVPFVALDAHDLERVAKANDGKPDEGALAGAATSDLVLNEALRILIDFLHASSTNAKPS
jgi:carboxyl-terminal processing protease